MMKKNSLLAASIGLLLPLSAMADGPVFTTDVIVDSQLCVGTECVVGETLGDITLKLKAANMRLKFEDTSGSTAPTTDWELVPNGGTSAGPESFAIKDVTNNKTILMMEDNAPDNALFIENTGFIGFGTGDPAKHLHIVDGDTPTLRLEQDGSSGWTPQTWDILASESGLRINDVTNGDTPFRVEKSAGDNRLFIETGGEIGIGTTNPAAQLHIANVIGNEFDDILLTSDGKISLGSLTPSASLHILREDGSAKILVAETNPVVQARTLLTLLNNGGARFVFNNTATGTSWKMNTTSQDRFVWSINGAPSTGQYVLESDGTNIFVGIGDTNPAHPIDHISGAHLTAGGVWQNASSRSLKKNIRSITPEEASAAIAALEPVSFEYNAEEGERYAGFIAEDVPDILANADHDSLNAMDFVALLTKVVQQQREQLLEQQREMVEQQGEMEALRSRLEKLEQASRWKPDQVRELR